MKTISKQQVITIEQLQKQLTALQLKLVESDKSFQEILSQKDNTIQSLNHQLHLFRTARFGRKSEKSIDDKQMLLFDEAELDEKQDDDLNKDEAETVSYARTKNKTGRKKLPKTLPYVEKFHDLAESDKQCDCGCQLTHIGDDISEQLDVLPQVTFRVVNIKKKYACKSCEETIKSAKMPKQAFPKCMATAGLVAAIIDAKFNRHLPLYRQEDMFKSMGMPMTRATLSNWVIKAANLLKPLIDLMIKNIKQYDIAYADETVLQVINEAGKSSTSKSYMWLFIGGPPDKQSFIYQYHPNRKDSVAANFFDDFKGYLHADCYSAYTNLNQKLIKHVACFAHARRYFMDVVKANKGKKGKAFDAVKQIAKLYGVEKTLKEQNASADEIYTQRQQQTKPILDDFHQWLMDNRDKVPPKSPLGKALFYSLKHWPSLIRFIDDGRLEIDNNRSERAIKPFVIGRKNWLFHQNDKGAHAGSVLFSLVQTCKEHDIDVFAYFKYALDNIIHCDNESEIEKLLPFNCPKNELSSQRDIPELIIPNKQVVN